MLTSLLALALATAPDSTAYVVLNHGRPAGDMHVVAAGDSVVVRYQYADRQRGPRVETRYHFDAAGRVVRGESRGLSAASVPAPVGERFEVAGGRVRWTARGDSGEAAAGPGSFYRLRTATPYDQALLARFLLSRPDGAARLLPVGEARGEVAEERVVATAEGPRRVRMVLVHGTGLSPSAVWIDERGELFASEAGWFITVREGGEGALPALREAEMAHRARRAEALARRLGGAAAGTLVVRNGDVFDAERGVVLPRTTVVVRDGRIAEVGPAASVRTPAGARVVDATGKTVIPGMWDMHTHLHFTHEESTPLMHLAAGVTTIRDLAADTDAGVSQRDRAAAGTILSPRVILAGFVEGPGAWAGPSDALAWTEADARALVARYDSLGYRQVKLYNLLHPDLVPAIAEETEARGMRLSGHVPRGISVETAVRLGFDEINHSAFLFSTFFPDSHFVPRMRAYSQVAAEVAPTFDVHAPEMTRLILFLRERGTVVDGTFNLWQDRLPLADGTDPVFGPTLAWFPEGMRRGMAPAPPPAPEEAARMRAGSAAYRALLRRLYDAGVTLVPGTDNAAGLSFHGELEIYERAGIPAPAVLQMATLVSARVMGEDADYGSVAVGKVADLVIVDGRPAERIRDLRRTETVVLGGRVLSSRELYRAAGLDPRW